DDAVARIDEVHDRRRGAEPRRERDPVLGRLERGEAELERRARRVRDTRVVVALVLPDLLLHVGGGLVDRHRDGARGGIRLLPLVDRAGLEVHLQMLTTRCPLPGTAISPGITPSTDTSTGAVPAGTS